MKIISSITLISAHRIRKRRFKKLLNLGLQRPLILNDRWAEKTEVHVGRLEAARSLICNFQVPAFVSQQSCARLMRSDFIPSSSLLGSNIRETRQSTKSNLPEEFIPHAIKGQSCRQSCALIELNVPICLFNRRLSIDLVV